MVVRITLEASGPTAHGQEKARRHLVRNQAVLTNLHVEKLFIFKSIDGSGHDSKEN